jgi:hypothetical protein
MDLTYKRTGVVRRETGHGPGTLAGKLSYVACFCYYLPGF